MITPEQTPKTPSHVQDNSPVAGSLKAAIHPKKLLSAMAYSLRFHVAPLS